MDTNNNPSEELTVKEEESLAIRKEYCHAKGDLEIHMFQALDPGTSELDLYDFKQFVSEYSDWMNRQMPENRTVGFYKKTYLITDGIFKYIGYADNVNDLENILNRNGFVCID